MLVAVEVAAKLAVQVALVVLVVEVLEALEREQ